MQGEWNDKIFKVNDNNFEPLALEIFRFQYSNNAIYRSYIQALKVDVSSVLTLAKIPFLPISFFKSYPVQSGEFEPQAIFESSGTTSSEKSQHRIRYLSLYEQSFLKGFELIYGPITDWCIIGLLPSYLERENSSLVYMVNKLIQLSRKLQSGFYLDDYDKLINTINEVETKQQKTLLIGVSFALIDFAEKYFSSVHRRQLLHTTIMETGGMKGRKQEILRQELHEFLQEKFEIDVIHSEYGMSELLSQAYSIKKGIFHCPPWMKILIRDEEDPLNVQSGVLSSESGVGVPLTTQHSPLTGGINIIDFANIYSCSFIATDDVGKLYPGGSFEVLGRMDGSDLRGCSLLVL